jgi:hypothetical protein
MALNNSRITSKNMPFQLSFDNGANYKDLVCIKSKTVPLTKNATENETDCGIFTGLGPMKFAPSGTAVCETQYLSTQCSFQDLATAMKNETNILFKMQNPYSGSTGNNLYITGTCNVTALTLTGSSSSELIQFDFTLTGQGEPVVLEP